ncbi:MAG: glycosyltransferase family 39 protein [Bacteroidetes bacterium]|nr:glycosyltransferase family 39 protein [Bacteroidota bacterium]
MKRSTFLPPFLIALCALILFLPFLGHVNLFDWDEINFAECAREMVVSHNYSTVQINFLPFWEKPPLFIWMQAISMNVFDNLEFAARFPNAICGVATLLTVYFLGKRIYDEKFARIWTLVFAGSILPNFYFHSGIIDPWFNLFIFLGIYQFAIYTNDFPSVSTQKFFNKRIFLSSIFIGLAVLTKGPVALLVFGLCFIVWRIWKRKVIMSWQHFFLFAIISLSIAGTWFLALVAQGKGNLVMEFIVYQIRLFSTEDAGHGGSFFYHWIILLAGCFPASIFAIRAIRRKADDTPFELHMLKFMRILFWVVLILFSIVKTKIIHYSSLCYFPLTYLATYSIYKLMSGAFEWKKWMSILLSAIAIIYVAAFSALPFIDYFKKDLIASGSIKDAFAIGNLQVNAHWNGFEWITGIILAIGVLVAFFHLRKKNFNLAIPILFGSVIITTTLAAILFAPRVEEYSQHAAIEYWKSHNDSEFYRESLGYKSYAQYFYGNVQSGIEENPLFLAFKKANKERLTDTTASDTQNEIHIQSEWMLTGIIDHPAYFVSKNSYENVVKESYPNLRKTGEKNGFVFWERVK